MILVRLKTKPKFSKQFPLVKSKFLQVYGLNNSKVTPSEVVAFLKPFVDVSPTTGLSVAAENVTLGKDNVYSTNERTSLYPEPSENRVLLVNNLTQKGIYFMVGATSATDLALLYSFDGQRGTYKQFLTVKPTNRDSPAASEIFTKTGLTEFDINRAFKFSSTKISDPHRIANEIKKLGIQPLSVTELTQSTYRVATRRDMRTEYGYGIHTENIPDRVPFGRLILLLKKLYYHNTLSVKNPQDKSIAGLRTTRVSEKFVSILMNLLEGIYPTVEDINRLPTLERQLYDRLITLANLNKTVPHSKDKTIADLKKRLKLIEAEIEIGNNNPMLKKEMYEILHSLKDFKVLTQGQISKYLNNI